MTLNDRTGNEIVLSTSELFRQVMEPLRHISRAKIHRFITSEYGITSAQFHTIIRIVQGNTSVNMLSDCMHVSRPNISRTVEDLVKHGLVNRTRDEHDRRNIQLSLTKDGKKLFRDIRKKHDEFTAEQFSILTKEELEKLSSALLILKKVIDQNLKEK